MYKRDYNFLNFKAKSSAEDDWVYGTPVKARDGAIVIIDDDLNRTTIRRETLCQKTNSTDVAGNVVYEGDIVATMPTKFNKNRIIGVVRFAEEPGYLDSTVNSWRIHWAEAMRFENGNFEVIGNVYDRKFHNAEYLKENWTDDWEHILYFVKKEAHEED